MKLYANLMHTAVFLSLMVLTGCGNNGPSTKKSKAASDSGSYARSITADSSMRSVINKKWMCTNATSTGTEALPYSSVLLVNGPQSQSLQLTVHYLSANVPVTDYVVVSGLDCYYSSADSRIIKCYSKQDPTLKIETSAIYVYETKTDFLSFAIQGAEKTFTVFDGAQNKFVTLAEFQKSYHNPFQMKLVSPEKCGFDD